MNDIKLREQDIDWLDVINLALKRKNWGKKYTLYTCGDVTISCIMERFYFPNAKAVFGITTNYNYGGENRNSYVEVDYFLNNFSIEDFKRIFNSKILRDMEYIKNMHLGDNRPNVVSGLLDLGKHGKFVKGSVEHSGREHEPIELKSWHLAIPNTAVKSFTITGQID